MPRYFYVLVLLFLSCNSKQRKSLPAGNSNPVVEAKKTIKQSNPELQQFYVDSLDVGQKGLNKIEVAKYEVADSDYVVINFYSKHNSKWLLKNTFNFSIDESVVCDMELADFNNDGLKDMTYVSAHAGRGANEVRRLFIYDKKSDKLTYIKNSESYPNMLYNKKLNCIDAFLVSGCNCTAFLKITKDTLREFASVNQCDILTVSVYDLKGNEKIILRKKTDRRDFDRFENYNPLKEYGEQ